MNESLRQSLFTTYSWQ